MYAHDNGDALKPSSIIDLKTMECIWNKLTKNNLALIELRLRSVQKSIDKKLNSLNIKTSKRKAEIWNHKQDGGGKSISINGDVIEKAAINFSSISGNKLHFLYGN